jgi:hypothetical protein
MKRHVVWPVVVLLSLGLFISCGGGGGGDGEADTTAPSVTSTNPASDATGIQISSSIQVIFDEEIKPSTATTGTCLVQGGGNIINCTISLINNQITITPNQALTYETPYTVTLTTGIEDLSSNPMASDYIFEFTTENTWQSTFD